ncbi:hypothetical protein RUM43_010416 [Polyplax serrata]|uniref:Uncharacterized protein n=1 Tax=Polyplax serrata TaxID=468196 RepID=A0AAN8P0C6_POLSC
MGEFKASRGKIRRQQSAKHGVRSHTGKSKKKTLQQRDGEEEEQEEEEEDDDDYDDEKNNGIEKLQS